MNLVEFLNHKSDDELQQYVIKLIDGHFAIENNDELLDALVLYEGATGLLRRLYQKLTLPHRETIALAFWDRLQRVGDAVEVAHLILDQATVAILKLADPFLSYSSVADDVTQYLEMLASRLAEDDAPISTIIEIHLGLLNMGGNLDGTYWGALARRHGEDVYGIVLSGLGAISIDSALEWISSTPSSPRLTELLKAHLPGMYGRAEGSVQEHLRKLVSSEGIWTEDAKSQIVVYCNDRSINLMPANSRARVPNGLGPSNMQPLSYFRQRAFESAVCRADDPLPDTAELATQKSGASPEEARELIGLLADEMSLA